MEIVMKQSLLVFQYKLIGNRYRVFQNLKALFDQSPFEWVTGGFRSDYLEYDFFIVTLYMLPSMANQKFQSNIF